MTITPLSQEQAARLDRLYRNYHGLVLAVAGEHTRDAETARDVAQETWIRVATSLRRLRDDHAAAMWLRLLTRRAAADWYRPRRAHEHPINLTDDSDAPVAVGVSAEDEVLAWDTVRERVLKEAA